MDNQHRKILGYRELNEQEIALMNKIKELGPLIEAVELQVTAHVEDQIDKAYQEGPEVSRETADRLKDATPQRFIALAKTDFQTALMYLTRAVAQPTFY